MNTEYFRFNCKYCGQHYEAPSSMFGEIFICHNNDCQKQIVAVPVFESFLHEVRKQADAILQGAREQADAIAEDINKRKEEVEIQIKDGEEYIALLEMQTRKLNLELVELRNITEKTKKLSRSFTPPSESHFKKIINCPLLDSLNEKQKNAVSAVDGIIRCVAGAGTGKTRVLTYRLAYLIKEIGIPPSQILSVTFTNKAAGVMKARAKALLGENFSTRISTFHGFCHELLKEDILLINWPPNFSIIDKEDQKGLVKEIFNEKNISANKITIPQVLEKISKFKHSNYQDYIKYLIWQSCPFPIEQDGLEQIVFCEYLMKQKKYFSLDFDDLILFAIFLLENNDTVKLKWNQLISYIQVDEFQDVNKTQYHLLTLLLGENKNLFVVGDPDQSIYSFRGAIPDIFLKLDRFASSAGVNIVDFVLDQNYRSTQRILNASNKLITHNSQRIDKNLQSVKNIGKSKPIFFCAPNNLKECEWISEQVLGLSKKNKFSDIAILVRSNNDTRVIENAFVNKAIPYRIINGLRFFSRKEIKDCLAYLRLVERNDDLAFLRVVNMPPRGIGKKRKEYLKHFASEHNLSLFESLCQCLSHKSFFACEQTRNGRLLSEDKDNSSLSPSEFVELIKSLREKSFAESVSDILSEVLMKTVYEAWLMRSGDDEDKENIADLQVSIKELEKVAEEKLSLNEYLNHVAIYAEQQDENTTDCVKIMTIHTAKGQEFPFVFIPFFNECILPSRKAITPIEIEEERRIAYVAMTRAERQLFISNSGGSERDNFLRPSRFLLNIGKELLNVNGVIATEFWTDTTSTTSLVNNINIKQGDKVRCFWGIGEVVECWSDCFLIKLENGKEKILNYCGKYDVIETTSY